MIDQLARWFAVCCKPRQELVAQENLLRQGFQVYLPRIKLKKCLKGKWLEKVEALFPRYIFIRVNPEVQSISPVRSTRGVVGLVTFGGQPAVVPDEVMDALLQRETTDAGLHQDAYPPLNAGDHIRLLAGPLGGMEGIFVQENGAKRVIIMLELLGKANRVQVNRGLILKVN